MKVHTLVLSVVLAFLSVSVGFAKSYQLSLSAPTRIGSVQLKPGTYYMSLNGTKAVIRDESDHKVAEFDVKIENTDTKFADTVVETTSDGKINVVKDIQLGGSKVKVDF